MKNILLFITTFFFSLQVFAAPPLDLNALHPHYVSLSHGKIEYYRFGSGSPIVLISGYSSNIAGWNRQFVTQLASEHDVILFDNRDVGGSVYHNKTYTTQALASDTHELVRKLHLQHPAILGISMGGMIAQQYAVSYPQDMSNLILINTVIAGKQAIPPTTFAADAILHTPQNVMKRYLTGIQLLAPPKWWLPMTYALVHNHFPGDKLNISIPDDILDEQRQLILGWSHDNRTAAHIERIQSPTLILNGGADAVIPPGNSDILAQTIPHAMLLRWQDGGHAMIYQYPMQIAQAVNDFLFIKPISS